MKKRIKRIILLCIIAILMIAAVVLFFDGVNDSLHILASSVVQEDASRIINEGVRKSLKENDDEILMWEKDEYGNIKFMSVDTGLVNSIATTALDYINDEIAKMSYASSNIPIGNLFSSPYTAGLGPNINIRTMQSGSVVYCFETDVNEVGINQTKFAMNIVFTVPLVYYSGVVRGDVDVKVAVPVYDVIIIGDVPDTYAKMNEAADFMNLMP